MANIKTTITTIRRAAHAVSLADINTALARIGERPITKHSLAHAKDLGFIREHRDRPGYFFTTKEKRAEIDGWSRPAVPARPAAPVVSARPGDYSAVQKGVLMTLRSAEHGVLREDLSPVAVTALINKGIVKVDKRDTYKPIGKQRVFVAKAHRDTIDEMLNDAAETLG